MAHGRRKVLLWAAMCMAVGSLALTCAWSVPTLLLGRSIVGWGIGMASLTVPIYLSEVTVPHLRGTLVTMNAFMVTFGQFAAGMVDGILIHWSPDNGWRGMLGLATIPALIMLYGFHILPESPRWLMMKGKREEAIKVLYSMRESDEEADREIGAISESLARRPESTLGNKVSNQEDERARQPDEQEHSIPNIDHDYGAVIASATVPTTNSSDALSIYHRFIAMITDAPTRRALTLGCGLMVIQQCSGINTVMYYAATIYEMSGFSETTAVWLSGFTALAQVAGIGASIILVDRVGRRELVLGSLGAVSVSLMGLGLSFYLARTSSDPVMQSTGRCGFQSNPIWEGHTRYAYDCIHIHGCGFCGGQCVPGDERAPFNSSNCPNGASWDYQTCSNKYGWLSVFFMIAYLLTFGLGMGGLPWTINSEIYPLRHRSLCVSISTATNWIGNLLIAATFLSLSGPTMLRTYGAFWLYGCVAILGFVWMYFVLPETKGLTLEEIEKLFQREADEYNIISKDEQVSLVQETDVVATDLEVAAEPRAEAA